MHRICMLAYTYYLYDGRVRREAEALAERGDLVDFICVRREGERAEENINGVNVYRLPLSHYQGENNLAYISGYLAFTFLAFVKLNLLFLKTRYDLIQTHNMPDFIVFAALFPKLLGAKIIHDIHDLVPDLYATKFRHGFTRALVQLSLGLEKLSCRFADHVLTVNNTVAAKLTNRSIPPDKCTVIMNTADDKIFYPRESKNNGGRKHFTLIFHGTLVYRYGVDVAIRAVFLLKDKIPQLLFEIYGGAGDQFENLRNLIKELGLEKHVYLSDCPLPMDKMPEKIASADAGIVPNRKDKYTDEILPVKLLELVAMGKPAIVARTETVEKYFDESVVLFFKPGDEHDLARAIFTLYSRSELRKNLADNTRIFSQKYGWKEVKKSYLNAIDNLLN